MQIEKFGMKELYEAKLKATYNLTIGNYQYEVGETVLSFNNLQMFSGTESVSIAKATGGKGNPTHIVWENTKDVTLSMQAGVLTKNSFACLLNSNVTEQIGGLPISKEDLCTINEFGQCVLSSTPILNKPLFVYFVQDGKTTKVSKNDYEITGNLLKMDSKYNGSIILANYYYTYEDGNTRLSLEKKRMNGVFRFEGKTYYKDDASGLQKTAIIVAPKVKLISNLQLILGEKADPLVSTFYLAAMPEKIYEGENDVVIDMQFLNSDIDATF